MIGISSEWLVLILIITRYSHAVDIYNHAECLDIEETLELQHCKTERDTNDFFRAECVLLCQSRPLTKLLPVSNETVTMDLSVVTTDPFNNSWSRNCIWMKHLVIKKLRSFQPSVNHSSLSVDWFHLPLFHNELVYIRFVEFSINFTDMVNLGYAYCEKKNTNNRTACDKYKIERDKRLLQFPYFNVTQFTRSVLRFYKTFKVREAHLEIFNITFIETVETVPKLILDVVLLLNITTLSFHRCNFVVLDSTSFVYQRTLQHLYFEHNVLRVIEPKSVAKFRNLRGLHLTNNRLTTIPSDVFLFKQLSVLDLSDNFHATDLFSLPAGNCNETTTLKVLNLTRTPIKNISFDAFCRFPELIELNLSRTGLRYLPANAFVSLKKLTVLNLHSSDILWLDDIAFNGLQTLRFLNLSKNALKFEKKNVKYFDTLKNLEILDLRDTEISELVPTTFEGLINLKTLLLSKTRIIEWNVQALFVMPNIQLLDLKACRLQSITRSMFDDFTNVKNVQIDDNLWNCNDCNLIHLKKFTTLRNLTLHCAAPDNYKGIDVRIPLWDKGVCDPEPPNYLLVAALPTILIVLLTITIVFLSYRNRWYFRYFILYARTRIFAPKDARYYKYDAFVSFESSLLLWVSQKLVPVLEEGHRPLRLCISDRDFDGGYEIQENIFRAIDDSRKTVFLVDSKFIESKWCLNEVHMAQHQLFNRHRLRSMIFVKMEDSLGNEKHIDSALKFLLNTRTYIRKPGSSASDEEVQTFWMRLRHAIES